MRTAPLLILTLSAPLLAHPPSTPTDPVVDRMHGVEMVDEYRWLEDLEADSPAVAEWTSSQNEYTRGILDTLPGRAALERRLAELMSIGQVSAPIVAGGRYFYTERAGDQNQRVLFMRESADGPSVTLVDPNTLDDRGLYSLDWFAPSHDGSLVAFGLSYAGSEMTVLHVMDVAQREWLADEIPGKVYFSGWAPDHRGFLYGVLEEPSDAYSRAFRYHEVGRHYRADPVLLRQSEPSRIPGADLSYDGRWIMTQVFEGWAKQDVYAVDAVAWLHQTPVADDPEQIPIAVGLGERFAPQFVLGNTMYLFTTMDAPNGMLYAVDLTRPDRADWRVVLPEDPRAVLRSTSLAQGRIVGTYQVDATTRLRQFDMNGGPLGSVELPGLGSATVTTNRDTTEAFISYTSYNEPESIYRVDLATGDLTLWARPPVPVNPDLVAVKQEWCTSSDGTRVPMFIVHKKGLQLTGELPTLMYGYGGFNASMTPRFSATTFPWFENGGVYVVVNLRGGSEYGESWHRAGMLGNKQNVFDDLYAAAEHLIAEGYTSPEHLAVLGGSNGGLLTGVAATQRPDLFAAVVSAVPLLDMLRYQHLLMAKFWVPEYGDPENPEHFEWLRAYSPYHNVAEGRRYPAILFTAGENDNRVHPMHARKMAARMQALTGSDLDEDPIMLWVDREAGHGQGKPLHLRIRDVADRWSFVMWQTGMYYGE